MWGKDPHLDLRDVQLSVEVTLVWPDSTMISFQKDIFYLSPGSICIQSCRCDSHSELLVTSLVAEKLVFPLQEGPCI